MKIGADLKFVPVSPSVGVDFKQTIIAPLLRAMNELCDDPFWQFQTTTSERLLGTYRCALIVKGKRGSAVGGAVSLTANVARKAMGIIPYQGEPPDPSTLTFALV